MEKFTLKKYDNLNLTTSEKEDLVLRDMSVWRQEQTGSKVSSFSSSNTENGQNLNEIEDNTPYHASRDKNSINKFYNEEDDFFYRGDDN